MTSLSSPVVSGELSRSFAIASKVFGKTVSRVDVLFIFRDFSVFSTLSCLLSPLLERDL